MRRAYHHILGPLAVICLLVAVVFGRLMIEPASILVDPQRPSIDEHQPEADRAVGNDLTRLFLPHHLRISESLRNTGRLPTWDPAGFGGRPLVGNPQAGIWYPPVWLSWYWYAPSALGWLTLGHLVLAGAGALVLARIQGLARWPAIVAASAFAISPQLMGHLHEGHYPHLWAVAWYPWAFAAMLLWLRNGQRWAPMVVPPLALCLLSGHPQEGYFLLLTFGLWVLALAGRQYRVGQPRPALRQLLTWCAIAGLALGIASVDWLPALALKDWVLNRTDLSLRDASRYHVSPLNALQLLNPRALGGPSHYVGPDNYWETQLAFGWTVLLLAIVAIARNRQNRFARAWLALAAVSLLFAMGRNMGVYPLFYSMFPGMDRFRVPARSLFLTTLAATQLAGHGIHELHGFDRATWWRLSRSYSRLAGGLVLLVAAGAACQGWLSGGGDADNSASTLFQACGLLAANPVFWLSILGAALFLGSSRLPRFRPGAAILGLGTLALLELVIEGFLLVQVSPPDRFLANGDQVADTVRRQARSWPQRLRTRDTFYGDWNCVASQIEKTNLNDYFQLQHAADLYEPLYPMFDPADASRRRRRGLAGHPRSGPLLRQAVLDRMAVEFVVTDQPLHASESKGLQLVNQVSLAGREALIYQNPTALPRAYVVPRAQVVNEKELLKGLIEVPGRSAVLMTEEQSLNLLPGGPRQPFTPASYSQPEPDRVVAQVSINHPGLLVISDTLMPGWKATLDGQPTPVFQGNGCQRVIPLKEPGRHRLEMWYEPPGLAAATVCCRLSLVFCVAWAALGLRSSRSRKVADTTQIQPWRLRSHHSTDSRVTKIRKNGQLSQSRTSF